VIVCLPRASVTSRYLKVPAQSLQEIEKIVTLQAPRLFPYPANELNSGFQVIQSDKNGYSDLNVIIVHKAVIERYIKAFKELKASKLTVALSSLGLCNLFNHLAPHELEPVFLIDVDSEYVELAIIEGRKLIFSRSFRFSRASQNWEDLCVEEINNTREMYQKEVGNEAPKKIVVFQTGAISHHLAEAIKKKTSFVIQTVSCAERIDIPFNLLEPAAASESSFSSLIGLGLEDVPENFNLLPSEMKETVKTASQHKEAIRLVASVAGIVLLFIAGVALQLQNKAIYLQRLKGELGKIAKESKSLEEIEKRFRILESYLQQKASALDVLSDLYKAIPEQISLINFIYGESGELVMRGQAQELNAVFGFVGQLQNAAAFKNFTIKVRYATKKKTQMGEVVDFEIVCLKGA